MKIYTYYENINFHLQDEMVNLWKQSWQQQGFDAIVLTSEDAKKSPYYDEFITNMGSLHREIAGKDISKYGMSCYLRWLAYSVQENTDAILVSDYDVINRNFKTTDMNETQDKISFLDNLCPCFAYATPAQYLEFCKDIICYSRQYKELVKRQFIINKSGNYHDQEFLVLNHERLDYNICPVRKYVRLYEHGNEQMKDFNLFHVAHRSVGEAKINFPELQQIHSDQLRIDFIKEILNF